MTACTAAAERGVIPESFQHRCASIVVDEVDNVHTGAMLKTRH